MAPHSSTLAWKILWMEEPGRLQSMGSLRVGHDTEQLHFHFSLSGIGEGNGNPLQCSCLENPRDRGAWWAAIYRVAQSWTRLKWCSSSKLGGFPMDQSCLLLLRPCLCSPVPAFCLWNTQWWLYKSNQSVLVWTLHHCSSLLLIKICPYHFD